MLIADLSHSKPSGSILPNPRSKSIRLINYSMIISVQGSLEKLPVDQTCSLHTPFPVQLEQGSAPWQDPDGKIQRLLRPDSQGDRHWSNRSFSVEQPRGSWQVFLAESEQPGSALTQYPLEAKTLQGTPSAVDIRGLGARFSTRRTHWLHSHCSSG